MIFSNVSAKRRRQRHQKIAREFRELYLSEGLTQKEAAGKLGLDPAFLCRIEKNAEDERKGEPASKKIVGEMCYFLYCLYEQRRGSAPEGLNRRP